MACHIMAVLMALNCFSHFLNLVLQAKVSYCGVMNIDLS
uniref:Uncharacterized protein n=1 Tax=Anguilla anguilla TaxID=7936 RepID=A0A0E9RH68_ANGAN